MAQPAQPDPETHGSAPFTGAAAYPVATEASDPLVIDCGTCAVRGAECSTCMVSFLLGGPPDDLVLDSEEQRALGVLAAAGLIAPLRLVRPEFVEHGPGAPHG